MSYRKKQLQERDLFIKEHFLLVNLVIELNTINSLLVGVNPARQNRMIITALNGKVNRELLLAKYSDLEVLKKEVYISMSKYIDSLKCLKKKRVAETK